MGYKKPYRRKGKSGGAIPQIYKGIKFRSGLEVTAYKLLEESELEFKYEEEKIILWRGFKIDNVRVFLPIKDKSFKEVKKESKIIDITYTPDFKIIKGNSIIYMETKGKSNDVYPYKRKLFLKHLEDKNDNYQYLFFEPHNKLQIEESIKIIQGL